MRITVIASSSSGNCYRISDGKTQLLIECGLPIIKIKEALGFRLSDIDFVLLSHSHQDHCKAHKDIAKAGIDIYLSEQTKNEIGASGHRYKVVEPLKAFTVGTFKIMGFPLKHDVENYGYLLQSGDEKLVFMTDTYYTPYRFQGLTHIMAECNYSTEAIQRSVDAGYIPIELVPRLIKSHMSLEHFFELLRANDLSKVKQIYLLHLSDNNSEEQRFKEEVQRTTGCEVYIC